MPFSYATLANTLRRSDSDPIVSASNNDVEGIGFFANIAGRNSIPERLRTSEFIAVVGSDVYVFTGATYTPTSNDDFMDPAVWQNVSNWTLINPTEDIDNLGGVNTAGVLDGQVLVYDIVSGDFLPADIPNPNVADLGDVTGTPSSGSHLRYNGTAWEFITAQALVSGASVQDLSDVGTGTPVLNDVLKWDGSKWDHLPEAGGVSEIGALDDVSIPSGASRTSGSLLTWNGTSDYVETTSGSFRRATKVEDLNGFDFAGLPGTGDTIVWDGTEWGFAANATGTGGSSTLSGLTDTDITSADAYDILMVSPAGDWIDATPATVAGQVGPQIDLGDLGDVSVVGITTGQLVKWSGTAFVPVDANDHTHIIGDVTGLQTALDGKQPAGSYATTSHNHTLDSLSNVVTAGLVSGDLLQYNGTSWVRWDPALKADAAHVHAIAEVTGLQVALDGKASTTHDHDADYASISHTHALDDLSDVVVAGSGVGTYLQKQVSGDWQGTALNTGTWDAAATTATAALNLAVANQNDVADVRTMTGTADGDTTLGVFTGAVLTDSTNLRVNLQELSDAVELAAGGGASQMNDLTDVNTSQVLLNDGLPLIWDHTNGEFVLGVYSHDHAGVYAPLVHTHAIADVTGLQTALDGKASTTHNHDATYAALVHTHAIADTVGLQTALDGKAALAHNHDLDYAAISHAHAIADVTGLQVALDGKASTTHDHDADYAAIGHTHAGVYAPVSHTHVIADTTGLQTALDGKASTTHNHDADYAALTHNHTGVYAPVSHAHVIADTTGLQAALDGKASTTHDHDLDYAPLGHTHAGTYAPVTHSHAISQITGLQAELDAKALATHNHDADYAAAGHNHDGFYTTYIPLIASEITGWGSTPEDILTAMVSTKLPAYDGVSEKKVSTWAIWEAIGSYIAEAVGTANPDLYDTQLGSSTNPADLDGDGNIGIGDVLMLLSTYGSSAYTFVPSIWRWGSYSLLEASATPDHTDAVYLAPSIGLLADDGYNPGTYVTCDLDTMDVGTYTGSALLNESLERITGSASTIIDTSDLWVGFQDPNLSELPVANFPMNPNLTARISLPITTPAFIGRFIGPDTLTYRIVLEAYDNVGNLLEFTSGSDYIYYYEASLTRNGAGNAGYYPNNPFVDFDLEPNVDLYQLRLKLQFKSDNGNISAAITKGEIKLIFQS